MLRAFETTRAYLLLFTVPFTILWARAMEPAGAAVGPLLVVWHACFVMFWMVCSLRADLDRGMAPRLGLRRERRDIDADALDAGFFVLCLFVAALSIALLVANVWTGLYAAGASALAVWQGGGRRRDRFALVEIAIPVIWLGAPATLLALNDAHGAALLRAPALGATLLGGAGLVLVLLLMLIRDRAADVAAGMRTTATSRGRAGAVAIAWMWIFGVTLLAAMGAGWGWWHWSAALLAAWTGLVTASLLTARVDDYAVWTAALGLGAMCVALGSTVV